MGNRHRRDQPDIDDGTAILIVGILLTLLMVFGFYVNHRDIEIIDEPGETIIEEELSDGTPLHVITPTTQFYKAVTLEPAPTQLLHDYVTGKQDPKCAVKRMGNVPALMDAIARTRVTIPTPTQGGLLNVEYHVVALPHGVYIHSQPEDNNSVYSAQFGTLQGLVQYVVSPGYLFETCEVTPYFNNLCVAFEPDDRTMQQAKWVEVNKLIINHYENGC